VTEINSPARGSTMAAPLPPTKWNSERRLWTLVTIGVAFFAVFALHRAPQPAIALLLLCATIVAAAVKPIAGLFSIVFLTLVGDTVTAPWYPFSKNLSSAESVLFLANRFTFSPLEILVAATLLFWSIDVKFTPGARVTTGPLLAPITAFTAFVVFGFVHGVGTGGDLRIALFEGRAMFVILPVYLLTVNLCDRAQLRRLVWVAVAGIFANALLAIYYLNQLTSSEQATREDLGEHSASVQFAFLLLLTLTMFLYRSGTRVSRFVLVLLCIPALFVYLEAQRRSAMVALILGLVLVITSLWWRDRRKFGVVGPLLAVVIVVYAAAFWNSTSTEGFPAQAIKTVVSPNSISEKDRSSDLYRTVENFNLNYTIRAAPVLGLGFGQKFLRPVALPNISSFPFYEYIPHNDIAWIWIKTGFFGFLSLLTLFAMAVREGARRVVSSRDPMLATMAMIGVVNVVMFAAFAFVDITWDSRSMVFLALSLAMCSVAWLRPEPDVIAH
jgi:hypothetical protein